MVVSNIIIATTDPARAAAFIGLCATLGVALGVAIVRYMNNSADMTRLRAAREALDRHHAALAKLDDEETPREALDIAARFSEWICDPRTPIAVAAMLKLNPAAFAGGPREPRSAAGERWRRLAREDLREALALSIVTGLRAFVLRWPECAGTFDGLWVDVAASPVRQVEHVIRETRRAVDLQHALKVAHAR